MLAATRALWDGGSVDEATAVLEQRHGSVLTDGLADGGVDAARRWFTSVGSCSVIEPRDDLIALGLAPDTEDHA